VCTSSPIIQALRWWCVVRPDAVAIDCEGRRLTYRELQAWVESVAGHLWQIGVKPGHRLAISGRNSVDWCVLALAGFRLGAIVTPINSRLVRREVLELLSRCTPTVVAVDTAVAGVGDTPPTGGAPAPIVIDLVDQIGIWQTTTAVAPECDIDPSATAAIVFTSGTTGTPKGACFSHRAITDLIAEWQFMEPCPVGGFRPLLVLPLFTVAGVIWSIARTVVLGGTLFLHTSFDAQKTLTAIEHDKITSLFGPPIIYEQVALLDHFDTADLSAITTANVGGARVPSSLLQRWADKSVVLREIYGLTEIGGYASAHPVDVAAAFPGTCGAGTMLTDIRIAGADGADAAPGEHGEILVRGPGLMSGYWNDEAATRRTIVDGWLHTGDLGLINSMGHLSFLDRKKDLIISGGFNISPLEIEQVIETMSEVVEVAVIPVDDQKFGETPAAIVVVSADLDPRRVVALCAEMLADYKAPRYVVTSEEPLPRMPSGKVDKKNLRETYSGIPDTHAKVR
jgi:fatty-acyl-CoA synthase